MNALKSPTMLDTTTTILPGNDNDIAYPRTRSFIVTACTVTNNKQPVRRKGGWYCIFGFVVEACSWKCWYWHWWKNSAAASLDYPFIPLLNATDGFATACFGADRFRWVWFVPSFIAGNSATETKQHARMHDLLCTWCSKRQSFLKSKYNGDQKI